MYETGISYCNALRPLTTLLVQNGAGTDLLVYYFLEMAVQATIWTVQMIFMNPHIQKLHTEKKEQLLTDFLHLRKTHRLS